MKETVQQHLLNTRSMSSSREMRRLKRDRIVKSIGLQKGQLARQSDPEFADVEFSLPDESRTWSVRVGDCPTCGFGPLHVLVVRVDQPGSRVFFVRCTNYGCPQQSPEFGQSQLAIRHWKLVAALSK